MEAPDRDIVLRCRPFTLSQYQKLASETEKKLLGRQINDPRFVEVWLHNKDT